MKSFNELLNENMISKKYNGIIDFTYLKEGASESDMEKLCKIAEEEKYYSVCVRPEFVSFVKGELGDLDSKVKICTVISFPNGTDSTREKISESSKVISQGADEIDVVMNYKKLIEATNDKNEDKLKDIENEIRNISELCHGQNGVLLKIIIETCALTKDQIKIACEICERCNVDFVKTSTGYYKPDNTFQEKMEKVKFMRRILRDDIRIKVSGGVRTLENIEDAVRSGADRIGTSTMLVY